MTKKISSAIKAGKKSDAVKSAAHKSGPLRLDSAMLQKYAIIFLLAGIASFFLVDKFLADGIKSVEWLTKNRQSFLLYTLDEIGRAKNWVSGAGMVLIASSFFLYLKKGHKLRQQWVRYSGRIFLAVFSANIIVNILKTVVGRYRPYNVTPDSEISFYSVQFLQGGYNKLASFPSGHATTAMAVCLTLYYLNPKAAYNKYVFAVGGLIMVQRLITLNHYFSDIVIGSGIGLLMAYLSAWFWKNFIKIGD
ncbi:MAG: phosphatase PAP2 family protein [Hydrotalea sp.]|nr:phosphatase PAP2 family protein [Hydrotalea sp.]